MFLMGFHFDGLDIGEHVQPKEGHDADEANSQPGRYKHEVHKLQQKNYNIFHLRVPHFSPDTKYKHIYIELKCGKKN